MKLQRSKNFSSKLLKPERRPSKWTGGRAGRQALARRHHSTRHSGASMDGSGLRWRTEIRPVKFRHHRLFISLSLLFPLLLLLPSLCPFASLHSTQACFPPPASPALSRLVLSCPVLAAAAAAPALGERLQWRRRCYLALNHNAPCWAILARILLSLARRLPVLAARARVRNAATSVPTTCCRPAR